LNLALLVHAEYHRVFGRIEIESDDGFQFLDKLRIVADLKGRNQVRLQAMRMPDPANCGLTHTHSRGHGARAPMGYRVRLLQGRLVDDFLHLGSGNRARPTWPRGVLLQSRQAAIQEAVAPPSRFLRRDAQLGRDILVLPTVRGPQHNARALDVTGRQRPRARLLLQQWPLLGIQSDGSSYAHSSSSIVKTKRS
jgi:hypothetical protein